jgi:hypothetical protein
LERPKSNRRGKGHILAMVAYMSPAKNLGGGGRGLGKILGGVIIFHEILQQICENLEGWPKNFRKMPFFGQIFPFFVKKIMGGGQGLRISQVGVKAKHPPGIMYAWGI